MAHELPKLPYAPDALEAAIDKTTMEIHHGKHHNAYVTNLNKALEGAADVAKWSLEDVCRNIAKVPDGVRNAVRNNGGGHWNHSMFWTWMGPGKGGEPKGKLADVIKSGWTDFATFKGKFKDACTGRFGSGWAWLARTADGKYEIVSTPNQDNPLMDGKHPVFGVDVWEHAYYLRYQNRRPDYVDAWWSVANWDEIGKRV
ncbi:MAG: superoxide dismutase Fe-Mn [Planctomycetota bacterium]|nr:MAG: superoxide dismutase Fe-Mn [Planctomycetota bacterium]